MTTQSAKKSVQLFFTAYLNDSSVFQKDGKINPTGGAKAILIAPTVNPSLRNGAQDASHSARGGLNTKELGQCEFIDGYHLTKIPNKNYKPDSESEVEMPSHVYEMKWSKHVGCDFLFEAKQPLGIALTSKDGGTRYAITEKDFLLSQVICSSARSKSYPLLSTHTNLVVGVITVTYVDKCVNAKDALYLQFHAGGLSKVDTRKNAIPNSLLPLHILEPSGKPDTTSPFSDQDPIKPYWVIHRILPNGGLSKVSQTSTAVTKVHGQSPTFVWPVIGPILLSDVGTANAEEITILVECRYVKWKKNGGEIVNFELDPLIGSYATSVAAISEGFAVKGPAAQLGQTQQTTSRSFPLFAPLTTEKTAGGGFCCGDGAIATKSDKYKAVNQGYSTISVFSTKTDRHSQSDRVSVGSVLYTPESYLYKCPNFTDYLSAGWQINLAVSIDFTGSNGNPREPTPFTTFPPTREAKKNLTITSEQL